VPLQVRNTPYMSMSEREDVLNDHRRRALTGDAKHAMLQSTLAAVKKAGRRAGGVQSMDKQRERANSAAVSFFWNYNTVESVLLFCAVLVNLAGVMFESGRFDTGLYDAQKDFLTWVVVVIIVVSVVYFIVVLLSEVYMMLSTGKAKPKNKADKAKRDAAKQRGFVDMADAAISADAGSLNPMFRLGGRPTASLDTADPVDEETRKATLMALITSRSMPSAMQWSVIQEACTELLSKEKELLSQLALAKKVSQTADMRRGGLEMGLVTNKPLATPAQRRAAAAPARRTSRMNIRKTFGQTVVDAPLAEDGQFGDSAGFGHTTVQFGGHV